MLYTLKIRKKKLIQLLVSFVFFHGVLVSQELPPIQNFSPIDYHAENQNWAISQTSDKLIYIVNSKGLLEFNGAKWKLYPSPNETIMRSVKVVGDKIYTGCYMEFGYWQKDDLGILHYTSLSQKMDAKPIEDEEFWHIINVDDWVVFQSLNRIYIYNSNDDPVNIIESNTTITNIFKVSQNVYFQRIDKGIFKIENGAAILVVDDELVKNNEVINIFPYEEELLLLTRDNGFYKSKEGELLKWDISSNELLSNVSIYSGIQLKNNSFAIGTIADGLIYITNEGELIHNIDQSKGLSNNTVLALFEDIDTNIWLGLDNGISYFNVNSPFKIYNDSKGILGSVYTSAIYDENLYLGSNQGLFYKNLENNDNYKFIRGTQGQVWSLKEVDGALFCGHNSGTFIIKGSRAKKIAGTVGTWNVIKLKNNLVLQGNYDGLYVLQKNNGTWQLRNKIDGFDNSSRSFEILGNEIFVNHEYKGVFKIQTDSIFSKTNNISIDTLIKGSNSGIIKYNEAILYSYKKGIFKYDQTSKKFNKDSILSKVYTEDEYISGKMVLDKERNNLWVFTNSNINFIAPGQLTIAPKVNSIPLTKERRENVVGYESAMKLQASDSYLFGNSSGYLTIDMNTFNIENFNVFISEIISHKELDKNLLNKNLEGEFKTNENNLEISFYVPQFNKYLTPQYQFQLLGMYDDWSDWSETPTVLFQNLPFGEYTFKVRARIGDKLSENIATYSFGIAKPWYISNLMMGVYLLTIILFSISMHTLYRRYYHKKQRKLIEKNKGDLELAKAQNEKEIIKIKNEQLKQEFEIKSKELAASTMSIVKKNELLTQIKQQLIKIDDKNSFEPVLKVIDKSLDHHDNWKLFKEAFDNVDRKFLKKLKKVHPNLSPNDLKLCAYLRLNLSSKEIAPLFNISARSVEIKRYRLRKKMNLPHEKNLVSYILEL